MKQKIIREFLEDEKANYSIYGTTSTELSKMYDDLVAWINQGKTLQAWLISEGAMSLDGSVRRDRLITIHRDGKDVPLRLVFKYFVYNYLFRKINQYQNESKTADPKLLSRWKLAVHGQPRVLHEGRPQAD